MQKRKIGILSFSALCLLAAGCRTAPVEFTAKSDSSVNIEAPKNENFAAPPFATKEPEKYSAKIVFEFKYDHEAANFIEQTYFVARDGANRRLDFQFGERAFTHLQTADGKQFVLSAKQKTYAEMNTAQDAKGDKLLINQPEEFSLEHLLHTKPVGATYEKIGAETMLGRQTTKYRLDFGAVKEAENARTETFVWADESLGLPIRTEVNAIENNQPGGAQNIIELREIKTEVEPNTFEIPKDFRQVSFEEMRQILKAK